MHIHRGTYIYRATIARTIYIKRLLNMDTICVNIIQSMLRSKNAGKYRKSKTDARAKINNTYMCTRALSEDCARALHIIN